MSPAPDRPPLVTVLLPVHNASAHLAETLASISAQVFTDFEIVAIDDGSTDGSAAILASHRDPRLRIVSHGANQGLVASLNEGLGLARGRYIARIDADDLMVPDRLLKQVEWMEAHPEVAVLASRVALIDADGEPCGAWSTDHETITEEDIRRMLPRTNCIAHPSVMIRVDALGSLRYDARQKGAEDWDLWLRLAARGSRIAKLAEPLTRYRVHATSIMAHDKSAVPLALRLLRARHRFMVAELRQARFGRLHADVIAAQARTLARHLLDSALMPLARDAYRLFTYAPWSLLKERRALREALAHWEGRHLFLFPYLHTGGAEQVHADILEAVADQRPLCVVFGFSQDRSFLSRFASSANVVEAPRLLNHPFTRRHALKELANALNARADARVLASNCAQFFELLPLLDAGVQACYLQHAFLHQPGGNAQHKEWVRHFQRIDRYIFIARKAREEYGKFLRAQGIPAAGMEKLAFIPNRVHRFAAPVPHEGPLRLLFVGRDSPEKRLGLFIRIAERLAAVMPGAFTATAVGVAPRPTRAVDFPGTITDPSELSRIYQEHDALVVTSSREGFPLVVQEAMAHGLLIAATPVGDIPARLDAGCAIIAGHVEDDAVLDELTGALLALQADPARVRRMREHAYGKALVEYGGDAFRSAYRALLGCSNGAA
jgi:glycosyltransferase involved in cell wall biosynthesis